MQNRRFFGDVVQFWLERRPVTPEVAGSSPVVPARIKIKAKGHPFSVSIWSI
jgi:hypothetical protein